MTPMSSRLREFPIDLFSRRRSLLQALAASFVPWLGLVLLLWLRPPASWPWSRPTLIFGDVAYPLGLSPWDIALLVWITELLLIKSYLMWARARVLTWLGASLISVNLAFAAAYYNTLALTFWPGYPHLELIRLVVRIALAVTVTWAIARLSMSLDPAESDPRTAWQLVGLLRKEAATLRGQVAAMAEQIAALSAQNDLLAAEPEPEGAAAV